MSPVSTLKFSPKIPWAFRLYSPDACCMANGFSWYCQRLDTGTTRELQRSMPPRKWPAYARQRVSNPDSHAAPTASQIREAATPVLNWHCNRSNAAAKASQAKTHSVDRERSSQVWPETAFRLSPPAPPSLQGRPGWLLWLKATSTDVGLASQQQRLATTDSNADHIKVPSQNGETRAPASLPRSTTPQKEHT